MASTPSEDSLLGGFIIAPSESTSPANPTSSSSAVYKASVGDQLSPPPYPQKPFSTTSMTVQATIPLHAGNPAQQHYNITDLSTQTATLMVEEGNKDKTADDMRAPGGDQCQKCQTATAQVATMNSDFAPNTLNIDDVKYVKEQPECNPSAILSVCGPSQNKGSGQSIHNTQDFTAGYLPTIHQAEPGNPVPVTATLVNPQDHQSEHLNQKYRSQDAKGVPVAAAGGFRSASVNTVATSATRGPSTGRVISTYTDQLDPATMTVVLDDGTSLAVRKVALIRLFGKHVELYDIALSQDILRMRQMSEWAFIYLINCVESALRDYTETLKRSNLSNGKCVELYLAAKRFGHAKFAIDCLRAIDPRVRVPDFVNDLKVIYDCGKADATFRQYFKQAFGACVLIDIGRVVLEPAHADAFTRVLGADGAIASDIKSCMIRESAEGAAPKPRMTLGYDIDHDTFIDRIEGSVSARRCRHCHGLPDGGADCAIGPCGCGDWYEPTVKPKKKPVVPKSGISETAPPSESGMDDCCDGAYRSYSDWGEPASARPMATPIDNVQQASQNIQNALDDSRSAYAKDWGWDGIQASSERMEVASASAFANDGWTVHEPIQGGGWDASSDRQLTPVGSASAWDTTPHQLARPAQFNPYEAREAAFHPQRQLQGPAPSSSYATPTPPRRALPTSIAARTPARVPDPPLHVPTPVSSGRFAHLGYNAPPIGMPNYVDPLGYARQAHVGNGVMHPTGPGRYGLGGRDMVTTRPADGFSSNLHFQAGELITNVVPSTSHGGPTSLGYMLQGIYHGRHGVFPESFVTDLTPLGTAPALTSAHRQLASPFGHHRVTETVDADEDNDNGHWESGNNKKGKGRASDKQAHVSDEEVSDDGADGWARNDGAGAWGPGPAEPRDDDSGYPARSNNSWGGSVRPPAPGS